MGKRLWVAVCAGAMGLGLMGLKTFAEDKPGSDKDVDIGAIMKKAFKGAKPGPNAAAAKGKPSLVQKAIDGSASDDDLKTLLGYCQDLTKAKAPKGDQSDWDDRCAKMVKAVQALSNKDKSAAADLKTAANCKECHTRHKED